MTSTLEDKIFVLLTQFCIIIYNIQNCVNNTKLHYFIFNKFKFKNKKIKFNDFHLRRQVFWIINTILYANIYHAILC
jgi:hypothetical protein